MSKESLRSSVWSSETLLQGATEISQQPCGLLCKDEHETDDALVEEYRVIWSNFIFKSWDTLRNPQPATPPIK